MKVRIGLSLGAWPFEELDSKHLFNFIDTCDDLGIDSLWFSERIINDANNKITLDPIITLAALAGKSRIMKFGTNALNLPARHPIVLAKELATLDFLSRGRLLLVVGLGSNESRDYLAAGGSRAERGSRTDECIEIMKALWAQNNVSFKGRYYSFDDVTIVPKPIQTPTPPVWIGGRSAAAIKRTARLGDGWLPAGITPQECGFGIEEIQKIASSDYNRSIPEDHFGVALSCYVSENGEEIDKSILANIRLRHDTSQESYTAIGTPEEIIRTIISYQKVGVSKFVLQPLARPGDWLRQVELIANHIIKPLQTPFTKEEVLERFGSG
jgi:probable F420-dependent oxidoreductase